METVQFETTLSSLTEIKIPDNLKEKIQLNQETLHTSLVFEQIGRLTSDDFKLAKKGIVNLVRSL